MKELEVYTDSVSAKMQILQNHLQELASVTIDSEWLKDLIDLGTAAVDVVTKLVDAFGGLEGIAGIVGGLFAQKSGWGFTKNVNGNRELGVLGNAFSKIGGFINKGLTDGFRNAFRDVVGADKRDAAKWLAGFDQDASIKDIFGFTGAENSSNIRETLIDNGATEVIADTLSETLSDNLSEPIQELTTGLGQAGSIGGIIKTGLKGLGTSLLSTVGTVGITMLATTLISSLGSYFYKKLSGQEHKEIIQKGQQAAAENQQYRSNISRVEDVGNTALERYNELRKGVYMSGNVVKNMSLSSDEYTEFLEINQQLADVFPSLQTGITDTGQSLVDLGNNAQEATEKLNDLIASEKQVNLNDIKANMADITKGVLEQNKDYDSQIENQQNRIKGLQKISDQIKNITTGGIGKIDFGDYETYKESANDLLNMLDKAGVAYDVTDAMAGIVRFNIDDEEFDTAQKTFNAFQDILSGNIKEAQSSLNSLKGQKQSNWMQKFVPDFKEIISSDPSFLGLGDTINDGIFDMLGKIDYDRMYDLLKDNIKPGEEYYDTLKNAIITPFESAVSSGDINKVDLSKFFEFDYSNLSNEEMRTEINGMLDKMFPGGEGTDDYEIKQMILVKFGYKYEDENGELHWNHTDTRTALWEQLGGIVEKGADGKNIFKQGSSPIAWSEFKEINQGDQQIMQEMGNAFRFRGDSLKDLSSYLHQWEREQKTGEAGTGTLADILGSEDFNNQVSNTTSNISALETAFDSLNENAHLTSKEFTSLVDSMPEMAEFGEDITMEDVGDKLWDNVEDYVKKFREFMKTAELSPQELLNAENYLQSYINQFENIPTSVDKAKESLQEFYTEGINPGESIESAENYIEGLTNADNIFTTLQEKYGSDFNAGIIETIIQADPSMATATIEEWIAAYEGKEVELNIIANDKELQEIQSKRDNTNAQRNAIQSRISSAEEQGNFGSKSDYEALARLDQEAVSIAEDEVKNRRQNLVNVKNEQEQQGTLYTKEGRQAIRDAQNQVLEAMSGVSDAENQLADSQKNVLTYTERLGQHEIDKRQELISSLNDLSQHYTDEGKVIDRTTAEQIAAYERKNKADYERIAAGYARDAEVNPQYRDEFMAASYAAQNQANAITLRSADQIIAESRVASLQVSLTELQDKATTIQDAITLQEGQGLKPTLETYEKLIRNGKQQIQNLERQNQLIRNTQAGLVRNSAEWRRQQALINSNNSAIAAMNGNLNNWRNNISDFAADIGNNLLSALQNAFNESISETGLQPTTMRQLAAQFEGIEGFDYADIFYNTAQGVKLDAAATERLVDAQYGLMTNDLTSRITDENHALANLQQQYRDTSDAAERLQISQNMDIHQGRLDNLYNQLAQYQAFYGQAQELFSARGAWQRAQQTENAGASYTELQGYLQTQEDAWKNGLIGTDEFKAYTAIFDEWGRDSLAAYTENRDKIQRYLTDDITGVTNLYDDLVKAGYGTKTDTSFSLDMSDMSEAAHALGISEEFLAYGLERAQDYGATNDYVRDAIQGELKLQEITHDTAEAIAKKNELIAQGAPQDVIDEQIQKIQELDQSAANIRDNIKDVVAREGTITAGEIKGAVDSIDDLRDRWEDAKKAGRYDEANVYQQEMENIAEQAGFKLNPDGTIEMPDEYRGWKHSLGKNKTAEEVEDQIEGVKLEGESIENQETLQSGLDKLKKGWEGNTDKVQQYVDALKGANVDDLKALDLNDSKTVQGLEKEEAALDNLKNMFGLTADEAQLLVPILQELGLIGQENGKTFKRAGQGGTLGVDTSTAQDFFDTGEYKTQKEGQDYTFSSADLTFDAANMSIKEINEKLEDLEKMHTIAIETEGAEEVSGEIEQLQQATKDTKYIKLGVESALEKAGMTAEEFIGLDKIEQAKYLADVGINPNTEEFDAAMAEIERQAGDPIQKNIDAALTANAELAIEDLQAMDDETLMATVGCDSSQVDETRAKLDEMAYSDYDVKVSINGESLNGISQAVLAALNGETYEAYIEANTEQAESDIAGLDGEDVTVNADANIEQAESGISSLNGKTVTIKAVLDKAAQLGQNLFSGIKSVISPKIDNKSASQSMNGIISKANAGANMNIKVDTKQIDNAVQGINKLQSAAGQAINININTGDAVTQIDNIISGIESLKTAALETLTLTVNADTALQACSELTTQIKNTRAAADDDIPINANVTGTEDVEALRAAIASLPSSRTVMVRCNVYGTGDVNALRSAIVSIPMARTVSVKANVSGASEVRGLAADINALHSRTVTITTNHVTNYSTTGSSGGGRKTGKTPPVTGTLSSIGKAYVKGTIDDDNRVTKSGSAYNVVNYKDAKARGDVSIEHDTDSLINEVGPESIIFLM